MSEITHHYGGDQAGPIPDGELPESTTETWELPPPYIIGELILEIQEKGNWSDYGLEINSGVIDQDFMFSKSGEI